MSALAPTLEAFFTERLFQQRKASPHTVAAYRDTFRLLLGSSSSGSANHRPISSCVTSTHRSLAPFWSISKGRDTTACGPEMPASPHCTRSFVSPPCVNPLTPRSSSECLRYLPSESTVLSSLSSAGQKSMHCWQVPTANAGLVAATTPFCLWRSRPAYGSPNSQACAARTFSSLLVPTCAATAKVVKSAARRSLLRPSPSSAPGFASVEASPTTHSFPQFEAAH